jgi:hypothetical protein
VKWLSLGVSGVAAAFSSVPVVGQEPEQVEQLEPRAGEWQAQYFGTFGQSDGHGHAIEAMVGISARLAVGIELEAETEERCLSLESFGPKLLYRITGEDAPVGIGLQVQVGISERALPKEAEVRLIAERKDQRWWSQFNSMIRRSGVDGHASTRVAYAWSLQHGLGQLSWLGVEASGALPAGGDGSAAFEGGHFIGPSLTFEIEPAPEREVEVGVAALRRIGGGGSRNALRLFVQFCF